MFNFHIGATRLIPNLIDSASRIPAIKAIPGPYVVPKGKYRNAFRKNAIDRPFQTSESAEADPDVRFLAQWHDVVAISQQAFLGVQEDFLKARLISKRAASRVGKLSEILSEFPLTLHFAVTHPNLYAFGTNESDRSNLIVHEQEFSWLAVVQAIHIAAPSRKLVVWDFQRPSDVGISFVASMLGLAESSIDKSTRSAIKRLIETEPSQRLENVAVGDIDELRHRYELELSEISRVPNVEVMVSSETRAASQAAPFSFGFPEE